jgi:hypothetical protein
LPVVRLAGRAIDRASGAGVEGAGVLLFLAPAGGPWFSAENATSLAATRLGPSNPLPPAPAGREAAARTTTDAEGRFAFDAVPAIGWAEVLVLGRAHLAASRKTPLDAPPELLVALERRPLLTGRLLDADGAPIAEAAVRVAVAARYGPDELAPIGAASTGDEGGGHGGPSLEVVGRHGEGERRVTFRLAARTDAGGRFALWLPQRGEATVALFPAGRAPVVRSLSAHEGDPDLGDLATTPARALRVRLVRPDGAPLALCHLGLTLLDDAQTPVPGPESDGTFRTDGDGWVALAPLPPATEARLWPLPDPDDPALPRVVRVVLRDAAELRLGAP